MLGSFSHSRVFYVECLDILLNNAHIMSVSACRLQCWDVYLNVGVSTLIALACFFISPALTLAFYTHIYGDMSRVFVVISIACKCVRRA
jgi:hypothetical protein